MKINNFKDVRIPKKSEYFARLGLAQGDNGIYDANNESTAGRKTDHVGEILRDMDDFDAQRANE